MSQFELPSLSFKHHGNSEAFGEERPLACADSARRMYCKLYGIPSLHARLLRIPATNLFTSKLFCNSTHQWRVAARSSN